MGVFRHHVGAAGALCSPAHGRGQSGYRLVTLSVDIPGVRDKVQAFAQGRRPTFAILLDETSSTASEYQVRRTPSSFFIDRQGVIWVRHTAALDEPPIDEYVGQLLP